MQNISNEFNIKEDSLEQNQHIQRMLFRVLPYWPMILLVTLLGFVGARIYLRYATKVYAIKARVIVNDDSQQQSANLINIMHLDTRNISTETEKEMEILQSRNLLSKLTSDLQLNVQYGSRGYLKSGQSFNGIPFRIVLDQPDSISRPFLKDVEIVGDKIKLDDKLYPCDTFVESDIGKIKLHINTDNLATAYNGEWFVNIIPVSNEVTQLQSALTIEPISVQSSILSITFKDALPERGLNILNNLLALYGSSTVDYKSRMSENTLHFLDERLKLVAGDLDSVEKKLQNFKTKNDIVDLSGQGTVLLNQLQETDSKISDLDVQMDVLKQIDDYVTHRNKTDNTIPATLGLTDPVLIDLLNQLYQAEFELQKEEQTSGSKNPKLDVIKETISRLKPSILTSINNLKIGIQVSRQQLQSDNDKLSGVLNKMPVKERQLLDISRQQGIKNDIYTFLLQKKEEAAINAAGIVANYRVIDKPEISTLVKPLAAIIVYPFSILLALALITIFIYIKEFSSALIRFKSQIVARTTVPVLAEIAFQPNQIPSSIVVEEGRRTLIAEEFRELRTNLNYITFNTKENSEKESSKIILITSSIPNEGKSFVAINTSISLSLTGKKVILLEFDLRKPKISKQFGVEKTSGLSSYLIGKAKEEDIIQKYLPIDNFCIIPSGPIPSNPSELLSSYKIKELFAYLKQHFDYIIIDSPPVGVVTDAKILANYADATLFIIRQNYTHSTFLDLLNELLQKNAMPNLNIVFNGIKATVIPGYRYSYSYGYGYGSGYSHGYGFDYGANESKKNRRWWKFW